MVGLPLLALSAGTILALIAVTGMLVLIAGWVLMHVVTTRVTQPIAQRLQTAVLDASALGESIRAMRAAGFFARDLQRSDLELVERIGTELDRRHRTHLRSEIVDVLREARGQRQARDVLPWNWHAIATGQAAQARDALDLFVVSCDPERVWWRDRRCVYPERRGYATTLQEWAAISRGAFQPDAVEERWAGPLDPVEVRMTVAGQEHHFQHFSAADAMLQTVGLRDWVNPLIASSGYRFEVLAPGDEPNVVLVLSDEEKRFLAGERGWSFLP